MVRLPKITNSDKRGFEGSGSLDTILKTICFAKDTDCSNNIRNYKLKTDFSIPQGSRLGPLSLLNCTPYYTFLHKSHVI